MKKQTVQDLILIEEMAQFKEAERWIAQHPCIYLCRWVSLYYCKHPEKTNGETACFLSNFMKSQVHIKNISDYKSPLTKEQMLDAELDALGEKVEAYQNCAAWLEEMLEQYKNFLFKDFREGE